MESENKISAIQNEQQSKAKKIINEIIEVLTDNDLSITEAQQILRLASKKLGNQKITLSSF